ncbi:hypothetical protein F5890DRAFT_1476351 [Lentinula detonsa]|uniref:Uncharacterized protein n=1 Tax=Lentinula detonsa TaxID=2804962 RepID=A0AA38UPP8_9AGAR|nr:hypothetical protein F5890DRAFT_1476351 [Lentinula detonsa]
MPPPRSEMRGMMSERKRNVLGERDRWPKAAIATLPRENPKRLGEMGLVAANTGQQEPVSKARRAERDRTVKRTQQKNHVSPKGGRCERRGDGAKSTHLKQGLRSRWGASSNRRVNWKREAASARLFASEGIQCDSNVKSNCTAKPIS